MSIGIDIIKDIFNHLKAANRLLVIVAIATRLATVEPLLTVVIAFEFFLAWWIDNVLAITLAALVDGELINTKIVDTILAVAHWALRDQLAADHFICLHFGHEVLC